MWRSSPDARTGRDIWRRHLHWKHCDVGCTLMQCLRFCKLTGKDTEQSCGGRRHSASGLCLTDQTHMLQKTNIVVFPFMKCFTTIFTSSGWYRTVNDGHHVPSLKTVVSSLVWKEDFSKMHMSLRPSVQVIFMKYGSYYFLGGKIPFLFVWLCKEKKVRGSVAHPPRSELLFIWGKAQIHIEGERIWGRGVHIQMNNAGS